MIEKKQASGTVDITRPTGYGPGGDRTGSSAIATAILAIRSVKNETLASADGREIALTGVFYIDPTDDAGVAYDVREEDYVAFTDYRGRTTKPQMIRRITPWYLGADVDYVQLDIG